LPGCYRFSTERAHRLRGLGINVLEARDTTLRPERLDANILAHDKKYYVRSAELLACTTYFEIMTVVRDRSRCIWRFLH